MPVIVARLILCTFLMTSLSWPQETSTNAPSSGVQQGHAPVNPAPPTPAEVDMQRHMAKQRNQERFAHLKKDTDHLLELATQLKKSVDQANDQTLSLEVIRKAEQIEKLAKQIRQKMASE